MRSLRRRITARDVCDHMRRHYGASITRVENSYKRAGDKVLYVQKGGQEMFVFLSEIEAEIRKAPDARSDAHD